MFRALCAFRGERLLFSGVPQRKRLFVPFVVFVVFVMMRHGLWGFGLGGFHVLKARMTVSTTSPIGFRDVSIVIAAAE